MNLRPYQQECVDIIDALPGGAHLVQMATGLGKTVTFASIRRRGRVLLLSHREELVNQPRKYFDCTFGVEQGAQHSHGEEVVSASVQSIGRRLDRFSPDEFDTIITDECHHAQASSYRRIYDHFTPRLHIGFTATPNRADKRGLDAVYEDIIFTRDLRWGIENGYLCDIHCLRANIGFDLRGVRTSHGDYAPGELSEAMKDTSDAIAEVYRTQAKGATLIFAASVEHAHGIADKIPGAAVVTGDTPDRASIIQAFTERRIPCLVNCMVFTEGTDIPLVETVIIARPTQSQSLYCQMVGRGLRLHPEKERLTLIDCVGVTGRTHLCTAPTLLGVSLDDIPERKRDEVQGDLLALPDLAALAADCPESWIRSIELVDLWAKGMQYDTHGVNWTRLPDGSMIVALSDRRQLRMPPPDALGRVNLCGHDVPYQQALDRAYMLLRDYFEDDRALWDVDVINRWGGQPATPKQRAVIARRCRDWTPPEDLTKGQASAVLNRLFAKEA